MISLKANNITAGYGGVDIINNLNLFVNEGEIVVKVGLMEQENLQRWKQC